MEIFEAVKALVNYAQRENLIKEEDAVFTTNNILSALSLDSYEDTEIKGEYSLKEILDSILSYAVKNGLCEDSIVYRDLFDTRIMGLLVPRPSDVIKKFNEEYKIGPKSATDYYYDFSIKSNYIRQDRIKNDIKWITKTEYGDIDITINLSKPEKDSKAIAAALTMKNSSYPKCMLCKENEGYEGRVNHPARQNHRIIPLTINSSKWFLQYSPYVYYNEHCILFNGEHTPMKIDKYVFIKLFDFVKQFKHYFIGSNAGLPIVGGSILTHEHFQGGNYNFAMAKAPIETPVSFNGFDDVTCGIVKWPMSVIRLRCGDSDRICTLADVILTAWREYTDEDAFIFAVTDGEPHNTMTPIARYKDGEYELDIVLRNNITTKEYPDGYYHAHPEYHNIKKENIGLIEVMGLAVLPSRLKEEMAIIKDAILNNKNIKSDEKISKHYNWVEGLKSKYKFNENNCDEILKNEIGIVFTSILEQCGVFERNEVGQKQFLKFINIINS